MKNLKLTRYWYALLHKYLYHRILLKFWGSSVPKNQVLLESSSKEICRTSWSCGLIIETPCSKQLSLKTLRSSSNTLIMEQNIEMMSLQSLQSIMFLNTITWASFGHRFNLSSRIEHLMTISTMNAQSPRTFCLISYQTQIKLSQKTSKVFAQIHFNALRR